MVVLVERGSGWRIEDRWVGLFSTTMHTHTHVYNVYNMYKKRRRRKRRRRERENIISAPGHFGAPFFFYFILWENSRSFSLWYSCWLVACVCGSLLLTQTHTHKRERLTLHSDLGPQSSSPVFVGRSSVYILRCCSIDFDFILKLFLEWLRA